MLEPATAPRSHGITSDRLVLKLTIAVLVMFMAFQLNEQAWITFGSLRDDASSTTFDSLEQLSAPTTIVPNGESGSSKLKTKVEVESTVTTTRLDRTSSSPSGWWPHDEWLRHCARNKAKLPLRPFPSTGFWKGYRLGDCLKMCTACGKSDTLAFQYKSRACNTDNPLHAMGGNMTIVDEVLSLQDDVEGFMKPDDDELVVHLRLGDVIEGSHEDVATMLISGGNPRHSKNFANAIKSAYEYLSDIHESGVSKVRIVGGSHKPDMCAKSRPYAECIEESIKRAGYDVQMDLDSGNPDKDFYYMAHAKKIEVSAGGYSRLVGDIAVHKGGEAIGRTFPASWSPTNIAP